MSSADTFDGAEEVRRAWMAGLAPDPSLTVSQGEYRHRVLSSRAASEAGNAMLFEEFPGGILLLMGTNSATGPRSIPARYIFLDEVDAYTGSSVESRAANTVNGISPNSSIAQASRKDAVQRLWLAWPDDVDAEELTKF